MAPDRSFSQYRAEASGNSQYPRIAALVPGETPLYLPATLAMLLQDACGLDRQRNILAAVLLNALHLRLSSVAPEADDPNVQQLTQGGTWARASDSWWHKRLQRIWSPKSIRRRLGDLQELDLIRCRWHEGHRWWSINYVHLNELEQYLASSANRASLTPQKLLGSNPRLLYPTLVRLFGGNSAGGVIRALLYAQIHFWITHNHRNGKGRREGITWSERSVTNWLKHDFPFLKRDAVSDALTWLRHEGYVTAKQFYIHKFDHDGQRRASQQLSYSINPLLVKTIRSHGGLPEPIPNPSSHQAPTGQEPRMATGHGAVMRNGHEPSMIKETEINKKEEIEVDQEGIRGFVHNEVINPSLSENHVHNSEERPRDTHRDDLADRAGNTEDGLRPFGVADQWPAPAGLDEGQLRAKRHRIANFRAGLAAQAIRQAGGNNDDVLKAADFTLNSWLQMPDHKIAAYPDPEDGPNDPGT